MKIEDIPNIPAILDAAAEKRIKAWPHPTNRASEAGHPCERFLILSRTENDKKALHDLGLQRIFDEGNLHEDALTREMMTEGIRLVEQQRAFEWPAFQLTGSVDSLLSVNSERLPLEIKSCSANVFRAVFDITPEDMLKSKYPWIRKYPAQLLLYMLMQNSPFGVMIFKNKQTGEKCLKVFALDGPMLEYAESILKKLESVNAHIASGTKPEAAWIDDCKGCAFAKTVCFVGRDFGPGIDIMEDPDIAEKLARREELKAAHEEFEELDKAVKEQFRGRTAVVGEWMIESKPYETTGYEIPKEVKATYAVKKQAFRTSIERI